MKKLLLSILFTLGLASVSFAASAIPSVPTPYVLQTLEYAAPDGHEVLFGITYNPSGILNVVVDPSTSTADQQGIMNLVQSQYSYLYQGAKVNLINNIPSAVNNATNVITVRTLAPWAVTGNSTLTSVPNLQVNLDSSSNYYFRAVLYVTCGAGGSKVDFGGTAVPTVGSVVAQIRAIGGTSIIYASQATTFLSGPAGSTSTATTQIVIDGYFQTNVGGTFVIQFAQSSSNAAASTVLQGSSLSVTSVP